MTGYAVAQLDEIPELDDGREPFRPVRHHFGITAFGITSWSARAAGDRIFNEHDEADDGQEELYLVLRGRAAFELDGQRQDASPAGTLVFVQPGVKRTAYAEEPGTTIVVVGGVPGQVYEPVGWELWAPINPLYVAGEYAEAADQARELVETPGAQYPELLYNLACCESLAGRTADALEHLRQAIALSDRVRSFAKEDSDLDPIRDEPAFKELMAG